MYVPFVILFFPRKVSIWYAANALLRSLVDRAADSFFFLISEKLPGIHVNRRI